MTILWFTNIPSPYRVDFFNELGKNCELTVLFETAKATNRHENWQSNGSYTYNEVILDGYSYSPDNALCMKALKWIKKEKFDIVVVSNYSSLTGLMVIEKMRFLKIPFVFVADGAFLKKENRIKRFIKEHFISSANWWLSTSACTDEYLCHYGAKAGRIYRYPFTSILEKDILLTVPSLEQKLQIRHKLDIEHNKVVLSVGRFVFGKGYDILLRSLENFPMDVSLYIVGGVPTQEYIRMIEEFSLTNVHFADFKSKKELNEYYMASDLFVLPTRSDAWGLVINEAMANGLPIITTDKCVAGLELVDDNNGKIIPVDDRFSLAQSMVELLSDDEKMMSMSKNSLLKIRQYTIEKMALRHIEIFNLICAGGEQ